MPAFRDKVLNGNYDKVVLFGQNEWAWYHQNPEFYEILEYCKQRNIPVEIITGACEELYPAKMDYVKIHWWDTYWIGKTYQDLIGSMAHTGKPPRAIDPYETTNFQHHYICMNNRPHKHRCLLIDLLAKNDLMQYGALSIRGEDPILYKWRYFNYTPMYLSEGVEYDQYKMPDQYYNSFAQLISESSSDVLMISEKTATPLILGKPFLVASQVNFHKTLSRMGFELYDEIFDYGFDSEPDEEKRYEMLLKNFVRLSKIPLKNLNRLQKQLAPKIMRNRERAREISYDLNLYPKIALEAIDHYHKTGEELDHRMIQVHLNLERYRKVKF